MSASLEIVYCRKAIEQAAAYRRLCRGRSVRISTSVERRPSRCRQAALQHTGRVSVTVAYQHCLEEGVTDDASDRRSDRSNLPAVSSADDNASGNGLAAHSIGSQQVLAACTCQGREGCGGIHHDEVKVLARYRSVHESHGTALTEHLL